MKSNKEKEIDPNFASISNFNRIVVFVYKENSEHTVSDQGMVNTFTPNISFNDKTSVTINIFYTSLIVKRQFPQSTCCLKLSMSDPLKVVQTNEWRGNDNGPNV